MAPTQNVVFTIGHSTHSQERFIALLRDYGITALCDVRSYPYSRVNPQFNRDELKALLQNSGIKYVFLGKELGARSDDPTCYEGGRVKYDRLGRTDLFQTGLERVQRGMRRYRLALMCAEKEPLQCHRAILVARHLTGRGIEVQHILADGRLESHRDALRRLMRMFNSSDHDIFRSREEILADAYHRQELRIAYDVSEGSRKNATVKGVGG